jgi:hypothetical protein
MLVGTDERGPPVSIRDLTFGSVLMQFANSVDHVDDANFDRIGDQVKRYVAKQLDVQYFDLQVSTMVDDDRPGLVKVWASEGAEGRSASPRTIRTDPDDPTSYRNQTSYSYGTRRPLWMVCADKSPLYEGDDMRDDWSHSEGVPRYQQPIDRDLKTSVIVPVIHEDDLLGVINLESETYVESTRVARHELRLIAQAIGELYLSRGATRHQTDTTQDAIEELQKILEADDLPTLTKPRIFIASSGRADEQVVDSINKVLSRFGDYLVPLLWSMSSTSGNITSQILEDIIHSRYGLCYFSEPDAGGDSAYRDNPNVIFEAGMLHSLTNAPTEHPTGWIPIREVDSPPMPFDFAQQRTLMVPRESDGGLDVEAFETQLSMLVDSLVGSRKS